MDTTYIGDLTVGLSPATPHVLTEPSYAGGPFVGSAQTVSRDLLGERVYGPWTDADVGKSTERVRVRSAAR